MSFAASIALPNPFFPTNAWIQDQPTGHLVNKQVDGPTKVDRQKKGAQAEGPRASKEGFSSGAVGGKGLRFVEMFGTSDSPSRRSSEDSQSPKQKRLAFSDQLKEVEAKLHDLVPEERKRPPRRPDRVMSLPDRYHLREPGKKLIIKLQRVRQGDVFSKCAAMAGFYHHGDQGRVLPIRDWRPELSEPAPSAKDVLHAALCRAATGPRKVQTAAGSVAYSARLANNERSMEAHITPQASQAITENEAFNQKQRAHHRNQEFLSMENSVHRRRAVAMLQQACVRQEEAKERVAAAAKRRQDASLDRIFQVMMVQLRRDATNDAVENWASQNRSYRLFTGLFDLVGPARSQIVLAIAGKRAAKSWLEEMEARRLAEEKAARAKESIGFGDQLFACVPRLQHISQLPPVIEQPILEVKEHSLCDPARTPELVMRRVKSFRSRWEGPYFV